VPVSGADLTAALIGSLNKNRSSGQKEEGKPRLILGARSKDLPFDRPGGRIKGPFSLIYTPGGQGGRGNDEKRGRRTPEGTNALRGRSCARHTTGVKGGLCHCQKARRNETADCFWGGGRHQRFKSNYWAVGALGSLFWRFKNVGIPRGSKGGKKSKSSQKKRGRRGPSARGIIAGRSLFLPGRICTREAEAKGGRAGRAHDWDDGGEKEQAST